MAVREGDNNILGLLNEGFKAISDDERQAIVDRWTGVEVPVRFPWRQVGWAAGAIVAFLIVLVGWNASLRYRVRKATSRIAEGEERLRTIFSTTPDAIIVSRMEDGKILEVNRGYEKATGYTAEEVVGRTVAELHSWDDPGDRERMIQEIRRRGQVENMEIKAKRKDGSVHDASISSAMTTLDGKPCLVSIIRDISEQKEFQERIATSLAEKKALLKEIHHRVKNNLHSVMGMLELKAVLAGDGDSRKVLKDSHDRILAMALIHEELYEVEGVVRVDAGNYITKLASYIIRSSGLDNISIDINIDSIAMNPDTAVPCGLVVTELIANSIEHAFPDGGGGRVTLAMIRSDGSYRLTVSDNGVGIPETVVPGKGPTTGLTIVSSLVENLKGNLQIQRGDGTSFVITFPEYFEATSIL